MDTKAKDQMAYIKALNLTRTALRTLRSRPQPLSFHYDGAKAELIHATWSLEKLLEEE